MVCLPLALYLVGVAGNRPASPYTLVFGVATAVLVLATHRSNIRNLISGTEPRIGERGPSGPRARGSDSG